MSEAQLCPKCGAEMPDKAARGLCPKCLLSVGMAATSGAPGSTGATIASAFAASTPHTGTVLVGDSVHYFGDYELLEEIARGGMGVVYKARQSSLKRVVAVKMILSGQLASDVDVQRFHAEAEAAANLQHPHIVAIHEVGEHGGQHYFSMDYVAGRNLADVVRDSTLPSEQAATWVATIAQAVQYAHEQGVLHRDLKPSNILVQEDEGRRAHNERPTTNDSSFAHPAADTHLKITDFGLAKRIEGGHEMTATGQALGTPSYMSPEQATGKRTAIGPPSDVYSLGAILYELITGRPPFRAATPLDTIMLVLEQAPVRPCLLNPKVPKDLETICLKCLEKDASRRYATAGALASDLQRFLKGEPIDARPAGIVEQSWRWLRKQRRSVALSAAAVAITAVLGIGGLAGWFWYQNWRLGYVTFRSNKPPIVAEVMDEDEHAVMPAFTLPTPEPVSLPADAYQLRFSAPGRMSQTYQTAISRSPRTNHLEFNLNLEDQLLWPTKSIDRTYDLVYLEGAADVILIDDAGLQRFHGTEMSYPLWTMNIVRPEHDPLRATGIPVATELASVPGLRWPWSRTDRGSGTTHWRPRLVGRVQSGIPTGQAPDLDGDGVVDLVMAAQHQAWLLAVSGKTGQVIWFAGRGHDLHHEPNLPNASRVPGDEIHSAVLGTPQVVEDMNSDGVADLIATFANRPNQDGTLATPQYWVELVSGASGDTIWRFDVDSSWLKFGPVADIPRAHLWFTEWAGYGQNSGARYSNYEQLIRERREIFFPGTSHEAPLPAQLVALGQPHVLLLAGTRIVVLDCATGNQARAVTDVGFLTLRAPLITDVDGDMCSEVLLAQQQRSSNRGQLAPQMRVVAWTLSDSHLLWEHTTNAELLAPPHWSMSGVRWPMVDDLDKDGRSEIIVPSATSMGTLPKGFGPPTPWGAIRVLDGTGGVRWEQRIKTMDRQLDHFAVGPDIDGDGHREIFVATLVRRSFDLYVDALSGKDGHKLWWSTKRIGREVWLSGLQWWHSASDGWPQLLVSVISAQHDGEPSAVYAFSSGTGRSVGEGEYLDDVRLADGNADGIPDLYGLQPRKSMNHDFGGKLHALQGSAGEMWRWLGGDWTTGKDYDGDGYTDGLSLLRCAPSDYVVPPPALVAVSGRNGRRLWQTRQLDRNTNLVRTLTPDLDGDGTPDVIATKAASGGYLAGTSKFPLEAISGRDGSRLWSADVSTTALQGTLLVDCVDLEQDGQSDVVFAGSFDWQQYSAGGRQFRHWLALLAGRTGKVRWKQPISASYGTAPTNRGHPVDASSLQPAYADLNDDGVLDIVLPAQNSEMPDRMELRALSGRDGSSIWTHPFARPSEQTFFDGPVPVCGDLESDGTPEVLVLEYSEKTDPHGEAVRYARLLALDTLGQEKWVWETPVHADCGHTRSDADRQANKPRPILVETENHGTLICLGLWGQPGDVVLIDSDGKLVARLPVHTRDDDFRPHVIDVDGDGTDEVLLHDKDEIVALRPAAQLERLWQWPIPEGNFQRFIDVLPTSTGKRATIAVQSEHTMYGLSGRDGRLLWSCTGPTPRTDQGLTVAPKPMELLPSGVRTPNKAEERSASADLPLPLVAIHLDKEITVCRQVSLVASSRPISGSDAARFRVAAMTTPASGDRRLLRTSPLKIKDHERDEIVATVVWGTVLAALLVVIPIGYVSGLIRNRAWSLRRLLLLPVVAGIALLAMKLPTPSEVTEPAYVPALIGRLIMGCQFAPVLVFLGLLYQKGHRKQWKTVTIVLFLALVCGMVPCAALLIAASQTLGPGERFTWEGWYMPPLLGCYLAGCAVTAFVLVRWVYRGTRAALFRPAGLAQNRFVLVFLVTLSSIFSFV